LSHLPNLLIWVVCTNPGLNEQNDWVIAFLNDASSRLWYNLCAGVVGAASGKSSQTAARELNSNKATVLRWQGD